MHRAVIAVALMIAFAIGMAVETVRVGDLIVMRDHTGECLAYNPRAQTTIHFGQPSPDGICHLSNYRVVW